MRKIKTALSLSMMLLIPGSALSKGAGAEILSINCNGCHGPGGVSVGKNIPSISGLDLRYFMRTMLKYKKGEKPATIMDRIAGGYSVSELRAISDYFSSRSWINANDTISTSKADTGREIHAELCEECHEKNGRHQDKEIPRISGQWSDYLYMQLLGYRSITLSMPQPEKMKERLDTLETDELEALSQFYASGQ